MLRIGRERALRSMAATPACEEHLVSDAFAREPQVTGVAGS